MNYRKIYQEIIGCKIPPGWDIHHIDEDRNNNEILNLLAIPRETHQKYHKIKNQLVLFDLSKDILNPTNTYGYKSFFLYSDLIQQYTPVYDEIIKLMNYRDYKLGLLPNFGNKNYY